MQVQGPGPIHLCIPHLFCRPFAYTQIHIPLTLTHTLTLIHTHTLTLRHTHTMLKCQTSSRKISQTEDSSREASQTDD